MKPLRRNPAPWASAWRRGPCPIDVLADVVRSRGRAWSWTPHPVPDEVVEQLLELAVWAPNHKRDWPWRFAVFVGDGRRRLGEAMAAAAEVAGLPEKKIDKLRVKYLRSPVGPCRELAGMTIRCAMPRTATPLPRRCRTSCSARPHWAWPAIWASDRRVPWRLRRVRFASSACHELVALVYLGWPTGKVPAPTRPAPEVRRVDSCWHERAGRPSTSPRLSSPGFAWRSDAVLMGRLA